MILIFYVDDLLITKNHTTRIKWIISQLATKFEMTNLGYFNLYLGVEFLNVSRGISMHQKDYMWKFFKQFSTSDYNPTQTPLPDGFKLDKEETSNLVDPTIFCQIIGKSIFLTNTCPYILFVVSIIIDT